MDGYAGFGNLVEARQDASIKLAFCWAHVRRPFYEFYTSTKSPLAGEVLARIGKLYEIEGEIRGQPPDVRQAVRQLRSRPLVEDLHLWLQDHLPRVPGWTDLAKAMRYALRHWDGLIQYLDDGRLEMDTNVVERAIRPVTITRKNSLFAGSDAGARHWAIANTLIQSCKLNNVEPLAYLTDVLQPSSSPAAPKATNCIRCCRGTGAWTNSPRQRPRNHSNRAITAAASPVPMHARHREKASVSAEPARGLDSLKIGKVQLTDSLQCLSSGAIL